MNRRWLRTQRLRRPGSPGAITPAVDVTVDRALLRALRDEMKRVVRDSDPSGALVLCRQIRKYDLLIAAPPPPVNYLKRIKLAHPGMCQECLVEIAVGTIVLWQESVGVWHPTCLGEAATPLLTEAEVN